MKPDLIRVEEITGCRFSVPAKTRIPKIRLTLAALKKMDWPCTANRRQNIDPRTSLLGQGKLTVVTLHPVAQGTKGAITIVREKKGNTGRIDISSLGRCKTMPSVKVLAFKMSDGSLEVELPTYVTPIDKDIYMQPDTCTDEWLTLFEIVRQQGVSLTRAKEITDQIIAEGHQEDKR